MKIINGDLVLTKDTSFDESIIVKGDIRGYFDLKVAGNIVAGDIDAGNIVAGDIDAWNINAGNINAGDIDVWNINAGNINAGDIDAGNINAGDIVCEKRIRKSTQSKTICRIYIKDKSKLERKEQEK